MLLINCLRAFTFEFVFLLGRRRVEARPCQLLEVPWGAQHLWWALKPGLVSVLTARHSDAEWLHSGDGCTACCVSLSTLWIFPLEVSGNQLLTARISLWLGIASVGSQREVWYSLPTSGVLLNLLVVQASASYRWCLWWGACAFLTPSWGSWGCSKLPAPCRSGKSILFWGQGSKQEVWLGGFTVRQGWEN